MLNRRQFLKFTGAGAGSAMLGGAGCVLTDPQEGMQRSSADRPNVILIMTDDQGYGDLGIMGNPILRTPHIDAMAGRSAEMTTFYVSPVCSPTRACLMTGRYNYRTRCIDTWVGRSMMEPSEVTVAELLHDAGYATGIFGKWHLGDNYPMRPTEQGFDRSVVHRGGGIGQPADPPGGEGKYTNPILFSNNQQKEYKGYCTDIYFNEAMDWIESCNEKGDSFFAYIPTNAPHTPVKDVPEALRESYAGLDLGNDRFPQEKGHALPEKINPDVRSRIFSMITNIDDNVGRLFERLEALGLYENTLVIFMVDNGPNTRRYVKGMRGHKTEVYEGGIRSPFFAHWPARLRAGAASDRVVGHIDLLPTLLEACHVQAPEGLHLDGSSFLPLLVGEAVTWPDRTLYIQAHRGNVPFRYHNFAARNQEWKLLHASGFGKEQFEGAPAFELYNMREDPLETQNLADKHPQVVESMIADYNSWFDDVSTTRPDNYAPPKIHVGTKDENPVVLTRQDWRHTRGRMWAADSNGYWDLHVASPGPYDIRLRFPPLKVKGTAHLSFGNEEHLFDVVEGATEYTFSEIKLPLGNIHLEAAIEFSDKIQGPLQVDIIR